MEAKRFLTFWAAALLGCGGALTAGEVAPSAHAVPVAQPPALDGRLDEDCWREAVPLGNFHVYKDADGRRVKDTEVRLAYDDAWLYLGIRCGNPVQKLVMDPRTRAHDGPVSADESVELFFSSDAAGAAYYHFMLSCFNVRAEQRFIKGVRDRETWNLPWRSAAMVAADGWTAEAALPLYLFMEHGDLEHVRLNIARNRRIPVVDDCNVIGHENMEHSLWRPVVRSFHEPDAFGALAPLTPDKLRVPFLAGLERVEVKSYYTEGGHTYYGIEAVLKGGNAERGEVEVAAADRPLAGTGTTVRARAVLEGVKPVKVALAVPAAAPAERSITVSVRDPVTGEAWREMLLERPAILNIMRGWLDRNYYTSETTARAAAEIGMPAEALAELEVAVEADGKTLGVAPAAPETLVEFSPAGFAEGAHSLRIALRRRDGAPFAAVSAELIKRAPKPGCEVKIDQINRVVLKDGRPIFPFGPIMAGILPGDDAAFKDIAAAGCNTFFQWHTDLTPTDIGKYLDRARQHGLWFIALLQTGWRSPKESGMEQLPPELRQALSDEDMRRLVAINRGGELGVRGYLVTPPASRHAPPVKTALYREYVKLNLPVTEQLVANARDAGNLLAYSSFDEPYDKRRFDMISSLADIYRLTSQADGYHPVKLLYSSHIPEGDEYVRHCDVLTTDPYWTPAGPPGRNTPDFVSKITAWTGQRAEKFRRPVWIVNVAGINWSGTRKRPISGAEQQCQDFLAIIHGAKGLYWFRYPMPGPAWENLKASIAKIRAIGPMAVQPVVRQQVQHWRGVLPEGKCEEAPFVPEKEQFPDVQGRIFRDPSDGGLVLLAACSRYYPVRAIFKVAGLSGAVSRMFADASLPVADGVFEEDLEPFAVRAYRLGRLPEPVSLSLTAMIPAKLPAQETALPHNARAGKKNVFPNPSFEENTVAGLPDYYYGAIELDDSGQAKFGRNCLKMVKLKDENPPYINMVWTCAPQRGQPAVYTFSFWARGERGGESIAVRHAPSHRVWADGQSFELTAGWQRYILTGINIPARHQESRGDFALMLNKRGTIWLDGFQLEQGDQATDFEE